MKVAAVQIAPVLRGVFDRVYCHCFIHQFLIDCIISSPSLIWPFQPRPSRLHWPLPVAPSFSQLLHAYDECVRSPPAAPPMSPSPCTALLPSRKLVWRGVGIVLARVAGYRECLLAGLTNLVGNRACHASPSSSCAARRRLQHQPSLNVCHVHARLAIVLRELMTACMCATEPHSAHVGHACGSCVQCAVCAHA
jgi:hypothetical protein